MAALPVIPDTFRCALEWQASGGQSAVNVIHVFDVGHGHTRTDVFNALDACVTTSMWGSVNPAASVVQVAITPLDGSTATALFPTGSPAKWSGQSGGSQWIPAASVLIKGSTSLRGREHRGRTFLPFTDENAQSDGSLVGGLQASLTTAWQAFLNAMLAHLTGYAVGVASYKLAHFTDIDVYAAEAALACQRRRQQRLR